MPAADNDVFFKIGWSGKFAHLCLEFVVAEGAVKGIILSGAAALYATGPRRAFVSLGPYIECVVAGIASNSG